MSKRDEHLPSADTKFIVEKIMLSGKVIEDSELKIGNTITLMLKEDKALHKRIIVIRQFNGEINFNQATALAITYRFMGDLLDWYRENKHWNEGGYFVEN